MSEKKNDAGSEGGNSSIFLAKELWIADNIAKSCFNCNRNFLPPFTRRHHCRMCGKVFCSKCSSNFLVPPDFTYEHEGKIRVCDYCHKLSQNHIKKLDFDDARLATVIGKNNRTKKEGRRTTHHSYLSFDTYNGQLVEINSNLTHAARKSAKDLLKFILTKHELYKSWGSVLDSFAVQPLFEVHTNTVDNGDEMNISKYIKIKKIPYPDNSLTKLIRGTAIRKNVSHKKMVSEFVDATIMMVASSIEVCDSGDITSLNQVIDNEKRQMKELVAIIKRYSPSILIVEKTINRIAQQHLLKHDITVLYKLKPSQFARIARITGAKIITDIWDIRSADNDRDAILGRCESFSIVNHENAECYRTANDDAAASFNLVNFDPSLLYIYCGKSASKGVTIALSGPDFDELNDVKKCLRTYYQNSRNFVLEKEVILQDIFLYHSKEVIYKAIQQAREAQSEVLGPEKVLPFDEEKTAYIDYTNVFIYSALMKSQYLGEKLNKNLMNAETIHSAGYFTNFHTLNKEPEDFLQKKRIKFTQVNKVILNIEDHPDLASLSKQEINALNKNLSNNSNKTFDFLAQICSDPALETGVFYSQGDISLGQFIKQKAENLSTRCEECHRPRYYHTSYFYREGCYIKISAEVKEAFLHKFKRKPKIPERKGPGKEEDFSHKHTEDIYTFSNAHEEETGGVSKYFNSLSNFLSGRTAEEEEAAHQHPKHKPVTSPVNKPQSKGSGPINMYLECDACKKKLSDEFQISKGYLEYSFSRFLEQFVRSGDPLQAESMDSPAINLPLTKDKSNELFFEITEDPEKHSPSIIKKNNFMSRLTETTKECCKTSTKSRVFKYQEVLVRFTRGVSPIYQIDELDQTSPQTQEILKQANLDTIKNKVEAAKIALLSYHDLVCVPLKKILEILLDRTQFNISHEAIDDIIELFNKKTVFSHDPLNHLLRDLLPILKSLESIADQINTDLNPNIANHIEVDRIRIRIFHQINETCEATDRIRNDYFTAMKIETQHSVKNKKKNNDERRVGVISNAAGNAFELNDVMGKYRESCPVPLRKPYTDSDATERSKDKELVDDYWMDVRPRSRPVSPLMIIINDEVDKRTDTHSTRISPRPISYFAEPSPKLEHKTSQPETSSVMSRTTSVSMEAISDSYMDHERLSPQLVTAANSSNMSSSVVKKNHTKKSDEDREIELLKVISQGVITYDEDFEYERYQKFPFIAVTEREPITFIAFALNCSTYMKDVYVKEEFKELEKLAYGISTSDAGLKARLTSLDDAPLIIKSKAQDTSLKGFYGIADSLLKELSMNTFSAQKKPINAPNFDLINDITGLIDLGLTPPIKNPVIERVTLPDFKVTIFYPGQFQALRLLHGITHSDFIKSLASSSNWSDISGGKSNAAFLKSHDDLYVIKAMKKFEFNMLNSMIFDYFNYMWMVKQGEHPTALAKILGMFEISLKDSNIKYHYILMENIFFNTSPTRIYDLKGSEMNRYIPNAKPGKTLLDTNFKLDQNGEPLGIESRKKREIALAFQKDAEFLCRMNRVDYSLLLILDDEQMTCKIGIIDYLREYTFDKQLEHYGKKYIHRATPTIVDANSYMKRFISAMDRTFMEIRMSKNTEEDDSSRTKSPRYKVLKQDLKPRGKLSCQ